MSCVPGSLRLPESEAEHHEHLSCPIAANTRRQTTTTIESGDLLNKTRRERVASRQSLRVKRGQDLLRLVRLVNFKTGEYVTILPGLGARVHEIVLRAGKERHSILESPHSRRGIIENKGFGGAKLIPYPGRVKAGAYSFEDKSHVLRASRPGQRAIHGFIHDRRFKIKKVTVKASSAFVELEHIHRGTAEGFPFAFSVRILYGLNSSGFVCNTRIRNLGKRPMPVGDGWHPYFKTGGPIGRSVISLPRHSVVELSHEKVPTGKLLKPRRGGRVMRIGKRTIDSVLDLGGQRRRVITTLSEPRSGFSIRLWQTAGVGGYRYLVVYTHPRRLSVALEPWSCAPDAFNNGMGLVVLKAGKSFSGSYGVSLRGQKSARQSVSKRT